MLKQVNIEDSEDWWLGESSHLLVVPDMNCWLWGLVIFPVGWLLALLGSVAK